MIPGKTLAAGYIRVHRRRVRMIRFLSFLLCLGLVLGAGCAVGFALESGAELARWLF